jgi:hypothetical protein
MQITTDSDLTVKPFPKPLEGARYAAASGLEFVDLLEEDGKDVVNLSVPSCLV